MVALNDSLTKNPESVRKNLWQSRRYVEVYNRQASMITDQNFGSSDGLFIDPCSLIFERSAGANDMIFCGYRYDPETRLYFVRNRMLLTEVGGISVGRWLQRDPIGYASGVNLYEYVSGRVANEMDPKGTEAANKQCCGAKSNCCGPDVTAKLIALAGIIRNEWDSLSFWQKVGLDWDTTSLFTAAGAWDTSLVGTGIDAVPCHEGTGKCKDTVTVSGKCYWQPAVSYWLAGLIYSSMADSWVFWPDAQRFNDVVFYYAHLVKPFDHPGWKMDWYYAGIEAVPSNVPEPRAYNGCEPCKTKAATLTWKWGFLSGSI